MAEIRVTSRCAGCPGNVTWLLTDKGRNGRPEITPEGECLARDEGREVFCPTCTEAAVSFLETRRKDMQDGSKKPAAKPATTKSASVIKSA
jgi:hypothetical protein